MEESFGELEGTDYEILNDRPFAEIFTCLGFFVIYFIEEIVHFFVDSSVHPGHSDTVQVHRSFSIHSQACDAGSNNGDVESEKVNSARKCLGLKHLSFSVLDNFGIFLVLRSKKKQITHFFTASLEKF